MEILDFNDNWRYAHLGEGDFENISLPHDAMFFEKRDPDSPGGVNTGFFEACDYEYEKTFVAPKDAAYIEFEGIYHRAEVFLDNEKIPVHQNGYFQSRVPVTEGEHTIRVVAHNEETPSSRWYTGAGIYRPVHLVCLPRKHIIPESITARTEDYMSRKVQVFLKTTDVGEVKAEILDGDVVIAKEVTKQRAITFYLTEALLWSPESPKLYILKLTYGEDVQSISFGIRQVEVDSTGGFRINGKRMLLLGACMHHDNGLLGAAGHPFAEKRKIELLKKAGYNAIRSAHNPVSKAVLDACDEYGMLVLDEYVDMWYIHKTKYDYANLFENSWQKDLQLLVEKDKNHPSVIMYSIGNEVAETSQKRGIELASQMTRYLHKLDDRPVTCGINIFFNYLFSLGLGVYSDEKAQKDAGSKKKAVGSEFINQIAGTFGAGFMKFGATLHGSDLRTRDAFSKLDVAGYNYGIKRYKKDLKKYPDRVILGSETFAGDANIFYDLAKDNPALIGDFVWTGMDYLGEVGLGAWEYKEYAPVFDHVCGWLTAGCGTLDIVGSSTGQLLFTQVAYEKSPIEIAVVPVFFSSEQHSPAAWRSSNAIESWSFDGYEGKTASVEVYSKAYKVELFLNGKSAGVKKVNNCRAFFKLPYKKGELKAVAYDKNGSAIASKSIRSAASDTRLSLIPEKEIVEKGGLMYVHLCYTDSNGIKKPGARGRIKLEVTGGRLLAFGNACPYQEKGYLFDETTTYYGEALAIIEPFDDVTITATSHYGNGWITAKKEGENWKI